jgi:small-conductance mechanosensitive channel
MWRHARVTQDRLADIRSPVAFAALWHLLWGLLLIPYAVVLALVFGGQGAAQDLVEGIAETAFVWAFYLVASLPINLLLAALTFRLMARKTWLRQLLATVLYGAVWFLAIHLLLPPNESGERFITDAYSIWAATAGVAYGFVLGSLPDGQPALGRA